jgi:hypothetical protein
MHFRPVNLLLLASLGYWATGVGQFLHEKIEHHHDPREVVVSAGKDKPQPLHEADDHDECLTCQTLKAMKAHPPDSPKVPEPSLPAIECAPVPLPDAPQATLVLIHLARAPPFLWAL